METGLVNESIILNGICYDFNNLESFPRNEDWEEHIFHFLKVYLDPTTDCIPFHTSGTTGAPSEVLFTKGQLRESARRTCNFFGLNRRSRGLLCLPCNHVAGRMMLVRAIVSGMELAAIRPSLSPLTQLKSKVDFAAVTAAQLIDANWNELQLTDRMGTLIIGGGEIPPSLEARLVRFEINAFATYGMTETLTHVALRKPGSQIYNALYTDTAFSTDKLGRLRILIPYLYDMPVQTNDMVRILDEHSFVWLGRYDNVINSGGIKLHAEQIEKTILASGKLDKTRFYVSSKKDDQFGEVPVLVMESDKPIRANLMEEINETLDKYEKVREVIFLSRFETTPSGKIIKQKF